MNKRFCIEPFLGFLWHINWNYAICCLDKINREKWLLWNIKNKDSFNKLWNSEELKEIRAKMLKWEKIKNCEYCYNVEKKWWISRRLKLLELRKDKVKYILQNTLTNWYVNYWIKRLDLRLSNTCNFSCRFCDSFFSSNRAKLDNYLWLSSNNNINNWNSHILNNEIRNIYIELEEVRFAWWEPLLEQNHYDILYNLIDLGVSKNINLIYSTNLSILPWLTKGYDHFLKKWTNNIFDLWDKFKHIELWISVDWYKSFYDYIRLWWKWENFIYNVDKVFEKKEYHKVFKITVWRENIYNIPYLYIFLSQYKTWIFFIYILSPQYYKITNISKEEKLIITNHYKRFIEKYWENTYNLKKHFLRILKFLNSQETNIDFQKQYKSVTEKINKFYKYI